MCKQTISKKKKQKLSSIMQSDIINKEIEIEIKNENNNLNDSIKNSDKTKKKEKNKEESGNININIDLKIQGSDTKINDSDYNAATKKTLFLSSEKTH